MPFSISLPTNCRGNTDKNGLDIKIFLQKSSEVVVIFGVGQSSPRDVKAARQPASTRPRCLPMIHSLSHRSCALTCAAWASG